jgi:hypothetical protein
LDRASLGSHFDINKDSPSSFKSKQAGFLSGQQGTGDLKFFRVLFSPNNSASSTSSSDPDFSIKEHGTSGIPFSTSRVDLYGNSLSTMYPYRSAGKLFLRNAAGIPSVCSASLIGPGLVLTAAHPLEMRDFTQISDLYLRIQME